MGAAQSEATAVRDALAGLTAARARNEGILPDTPSQPGTSEVHRVGAWTTGLFAAALCVLLGSGLVLARSEALGPGCTSITYELQGSAPGFAVDELRLALRELSSRTGLVFEAGTPGDSTLVVTWSDGGVAMGASAPSSSEGGNGRFIGFGSGTHQAVHGGTELVDAAVEVDGTASWRRGLHRGNGLAAVFVHELGHAVLGLEHSPHPTSFMYHRASGEVRLWTSDDRARLADAGRAFGCQPPPQRGAAGSTSR